MVERDFFELTGVNFDPPDNVEKLKKAIDAAISFQSGKKNGNQANDAEINNTIAFLNHCKEIFIEGSKTSRAFKEKANEKKSNAKAMLVRLAERKYKSLNPTGDRSFRITISSAEVKEASRKMGLSSSTGEATFKEVGFAIETPVEIETLNKKLPKVPVAKKALFKGIQEKIKALRTLNKYAERDTVKYKGRDKVFDIYGFAAYLRSEIDNVADYVKESTSKLQNIMAQIITEYPTSTGDDKISFYNDLASSALKHIFKDESSRTAYNLYIMYHSDELERIYDEIKKTPDFMLKNSEIAESFIADIDKVFQDYEISLAIYNQEAGILKSNPYLPERRTYYISCSNCGVQNKFASLVEAESIDECQYCHSKLFKICQKCGKKVLQHSAQCGCGYDFPNLTKFNNYIWHSEDALKKGLLDEAEEYLNKAKESAPDEKDRSVALARQILTEQLKYAAPKKKLELYISQKQFRKADAYVNDVMAKYPQLNVEAQRKLITSTLSDCRTRFEMARSKGRKERIDVAIDVLDICTDYIAAIEFLRMTPPLKCTGFISSPNASTNSIVLNWQMQAEREVSYRLLRKDGNAKPINEEDGTVIVKNFAGNSFTDSNVIPGKKYTYALFAERREVFSEPVYIACSVLAVVSDIRYTQTVGKLHFDWKIPSNCESVIVSKIVDRRESIVTQNARNNADDSALEYNKQHVYSFVANYGLAGKSDSIQISVVPTIIIDSFSINVKKIKDNIFDVTWDIRQGGIDLQILVDSNVVEQSRSDMKHCQIELPANSFCKVQVKAFSGGKWVDSRKAIDINTYQPWDFSAVSRETTETSARGSIKKIQIDITMKGNAPIGVESILYFVRIKNDLSDPVPWVTEDEALTASDGCRVSLAAYSQNDKLIHTRIAKHEDAYYITLFSCYKVAGKEVLSAPARRKITRPLHANIFWEITKGLFSGKKLEIETRANRPIIRRPALVLCASPSGKHLLSENDSAGEMVLQISEKTLDKPVSVLTETFDISNTLSRGEKLFVFEINRVPSEEFDIRWQKGFEGKA